jgi:alpha-beta hydrolase superfamily lysophospholipase
MKLNVHDWGIGTHNALLVYGLFADNKNWSRVGPALAERDYRVIAQDLCGHGGSPRGAYSHELRAVGVNAPKRQQIKCLVS